MLVSVIVPNYNYERYVGQAIESALNLDWPIVEVIVVDDGSTDGSRAVIDRYRDRVKVIHKSNGGQTDACNVGFAACHGEVVIFLDSDDLLDPSLMKEVARVWRSGVSKVQVQMQIIDAEGRLTGVVFPAYRSRPTPRRVRDWVVSSGAYPTPPGSGNAYAAAQLARIFPLEGDEPASDSYLLAAAPWLGDVVTIAKPLVSYRVHGKNDGAMAHVDAARLGREVTRAAWRWEYSKTVAQRVGASFSAGSADRSMITLTYRLASLRLSPGIHPRPDDTLVSLLGLFCRAAVVRQGLTLSGQLALLAWAFAVAAAPAPVAETLVSWRFASTQRPKRIGRLLRLFGVGR